MPELRIAVGQAAATSGSTTGNVTTACRLVDMAADRAASLLLLPEAFLAGYDPELFAAGLGRVAVDPTGPELAPLREACARRGVAAVVGACLARRDGVTNSAVVIGKDGELRGIYDKIHLWTTEQPYFLPGVRQLLIELTGFQVGIAICYDAGFPEHCRALALAGAELILCPSAFSRGEEERRYDLYFPMRALENTVFLAVANHVGRAGGLDFFGRSAVFDPSGAPLAVAGSEEAVIVADISHERIAAVRGELRYLEHRRPEVYGAVTTEDVKNGIATVPAL
jgi:5-aminopentanamidase